MKPPYRGGRSRRLYFEQAPQVSLMASLHVDVPAKVVDPVCGMTVDPARAAGHVEYQGNTYYFCGRGCVEKFRADPARFIEPRTEPAPATAPGAGITILPSMRC